MKDLKMDDIEISRLGEVVITFNQEVIGPSIESINFNPPHTSINKGRLLANTT